MGCTSSKNLEENATDIAPGRNVRQRSLLVPILSIPSHKSMTRLFQHEENKRPISINNNEPKKLETFQFNYNKFSSSPNSTQKPLKYVNSFKRINSHSILSNSYRIKQSMTTPRSVLVHSKHLSSSDHNYSETSNKLPIVSISPEFSNRASDYRDFNTKLSNKERTPDISMTPDVLSMKSNYFSGKTSCNIKGVVYPSDYIITPIDDNILDKSITSSVNNKSFIGSFPPYEAPPTLLRTPTISNSCVELSVNGKCVNVTVEDYGHTDFNEDDEYLDNTEDQLISIEDDAMLGSTASTTITNVSISNETQGINSLSNSLTHSNSNAPNFLNSLRHYEDIRNNLHRAKSFAIRSRTSTLNGCDDCDSPPKMFGRSDMLRKCSSKVDLLASLEMDFAPSYNYYAKEQEIPWLPDDKAFVTHENPLKAFSTKNTLYPRPDPYMRNNYSLSILYDGDAIEQPMRQTNSP